METSSITNTYASWSDFPFNSIVTTTDGEYKAVNTDIRYVGIYVNSTEKTAHNNGWYVGYAYQGNSAMTSVPSNQFNRSWNTWAVPNILIDSDEFASYLDGFATGLMNSNWPGAENPTGSYGVRYRFDPVLNMLKTNANSNITALNNHLTTDMALVDTISFDTISG